MMTFAGLLVAPQVTREHREAEGYIRLLYRHLLQREPAEAELGHWTQQVLRGLLPGRALELFVDSAEYKQRIGGLKPAHPPGHYYSPVINPEELRAMGLPRRTMDPSDIHGVALDPDGMREWWQRNADTIGRTAFATVAEPSSRYFASNGIYPVGDATILRALIAERQPRLIVEIGSGLSTACMLDAIDEFQLPTSIVAIEPDPARLLDRLRPADFTKVELIEKPVQEVPVERFEELQANDILFIDSTHVLKTGSDVHHELFTILPRLASGVLIHFHDIHYPFEYPDDWIFERRYSWNEVYALRAFLMHNGAYDILFMTSFFATIGQDLINRTYSQFSINPGGSLWLVKK